MRKKRYSAEFKEFIPYKLRADNGFGLFRLSNEFLLVYSDKKLFNHYELIGSIKACLNCTEMLCIMFKAGQCAQQRWNLLRSFRQLGKVIASIQFKEGNKVTV